MGMVGEGCYHHKQCCGDAAWASRPEEGAGDWGEGDPRRSQPVVAVWSTVGEWQWEGDV